MRGVEEKTVCLVCNALAKAWKDKVTIDKEQK